MLSSLRSISLWYWLTVNVEHLINYFAFHNGNAMRLAKFDSIRVHLMLSWSFSIRHLVLAFVVVGVVMSSIFALIEGRCGPLLMLLSPVDHPSRSLPELLWAHPLWLQDGVYYAPQVQKGCPQVHCPLLMFRRLWGLKRTHDCTELIISSSGVLTDANMTTLLCQIWLIKAALCVVHFWGFCLCWWVRVWEGSSIC